MKTLNTELYGKTNGQERSKSTYKIQLNLNPELTDRARQAKFLLEQHEGSSMSWTLFFFRALNALAADLNKRPAPKVNQLL